MSDKKKISDEEIENEEIETEEIETEKETKSDDEGGMPEWAKKLQNKMTELEQKLNQSPKKEEKEPVVMIPEPIRKTESEQEQEQQEQETPKPTAREKVNSFLNWLK